MKSIASRLSALPLLLACLIVALVAVAVISIAPPPALAMSKMVTAPPPPVAEAIPAAEYAAVTATREKAMKAYTAANNAALGKAYDTLNVEYSRVRSAYSVGNRAEFDKGVAGVNAAASAICGGSC